MDDERLRRTRDAMAAADMDALVCRLPENVRMLSGHWPLIGLSFLLFPREGTPLLVVPHCEESEAREELWEAECVSFLYAVLEAGDAYTEIASLLTDAARGRRWSRIGYEGSFEAVAPPWNAAEPTVPAAMTAAMLESLFTSERLVDATELLMQLRSRKTTDEQSALRAVNEISAFGLEAFRDLAREGTSGVELVAGVEHAVMVRGPGHRGVQRARAFAQVSTGPQETLLGYRPMEISTTRKLEPGDIALLELAVVADGFWADRTRPRVAGTADEAVRAMYDGVCQAQDAAIQAVAPGRTTGEVDAAARAIIHDAGFTDREFLHVTGHGLGFRYHEPAPLLLPGGNVELEAGMVHSVEPGVYLPGIGGIRIEDDVIVTSGGAEIMGPFSRALAD